MLQMKDGSQHAYGGINATASAVHHALGWLWPLCPIGATLDGQHYDPMALLQPGFQMAGLESLISRHGQPSTLRQEGVQDRGLPRVSRSQGPVLHHRVPGDGQMEPEVEEFGSLAGNDSSLPPKKVSETKPKAMTSLSAKRG